MRLIGFDEDVEESVELFYMLVTHWNDITFKKYTIKTLSIWVSMYDDEIFNIQIMFIEL